MGFLLQAQREYAKAEPYCRDALAMSQRLYPKDKYPRGHPELATSLNGLGVLLQAQGEYAKAEPYYRDALAMRRQLYPKDKYPQGHPHLATSLNSLGSLLRAQGEYAKAEPYDRDALAMNQRLYPKDKYPQGHPHLATSLNNLGFLLQTQGEYAKAESYLRDALAEYQKVYPKDKYPRGHPDLATSLSNLGALLQAQGEYVKAESFCREALAMRQALYPTQKYPQGHPDLAVNLNGLGASLQLQGEYAKAEPYYRDALAMNQRLYPKDKYPQRDAHLATTLNNLGMLLQDQGEYAKAEPYYRDALAMNQRLYPKDKYPQRDPHLAKSLSNLGALLQAQGEYAKAEPCVRDSLAIYQALFDRLADTASEAEALNFAASFPLTRDGLVSVQRHRPADSAAYDLLWQSRSALTRLIRRRHIDLLASQDGTLRDGFVELQSARQRLARLLLSPAKDPAEHARLVQELSDKKEELEKSLARKLRVATPALKERRTPNQLSAALPEGAAFIDLFRFIDFSQDPKVPGAKGQRRTPRYQGFVLRKGNPPARVDLGEAAPIEKAWDAWHAALVAGKPDRNAAVEMGRLVWQPLRKYLPTPTRVVWIAPDGALTQVPWAALPGAKPDTVLLEDHAVAVVPHGHFLLQGLESKPAENTPRPPDTLLAVGGVAYDQAPGEVEKIKDAFVVRGPAVGEKRVKWGSLPGTDRERQQIVALASRLLKTKPIERSGGAASAAQVIEDLPKVRYAHFATHGFFADPKFRSAFQVDERQFQHFGMERKTAGARSPLVLSGLVFAGANKVETPDRGILTAEGIVGLRLEDLELAVLSACETGLGEVAGGEGVFGLQRAFHVAGARNVIASLWKVDDDATAALMILFYRNLWIAKQKPLEALRQAQLHLYRHPEQIAVLAKARGIDLTEKELPEVVTTPAQGTKTHAGKWAGFVLSGVD